VETDTPARLLGLPLWQRRSLLRLMERDLDIAYSNDEPRASLTDTQEVRLKLGWDEVRAHLRRVFSRAAPTRERRVSATVSARRAEAATPQHGLVGNDLWKPIWKIVDLGPRNLRIKARFVSDTGPLVIGMPVVYGIGTNGLAQPMLGRVARLLHTEAGVLVVDIATLARFATLVRLHPHADGAVGAKESLPVLLIYDDDFGWGVLAPAGEAEIRVPLHEGARIEIRTKHRSLGARLRSLREATGEFLLFQTDAQGLTLGEPSYPRGRPSVEHRDPTANWHAFLSDSSRP